ncbi:MAG: hypothetical protein H0T73_23110 [Ardenticatenales bacterium]|nr:hypothetical protein [Ardenticatenales bacterium]
MSEISVALVTTLYDPESRMAQMAEPLAERWLKHFAEVLIFTSPEGKGRTGARLAEQGLRVVEDTGKQGVEQMGRIRLRALEAAAANHYSHYLLIDFDRLIHWESHHPAELRRVQSAMPNYDLLVLGRTPRAFQTHPRIQQETERLANEAFAAFFGAPLDVTGGGRALSARAISTIRAYSRCEGMGVDGEWPVLCHRLGLHVGYILAEGLEYETADRYQEEISTLGYEKWLERHVNTPATWEQRLRFAHQIVAATRDAKERQL